MNTSWFQVMKTYYYMKTYEQKICNNWIYQKTYWLKIRTLVQKLKQLIESNKTDESLRL